MTRRTKILATLGPAIDTKEQLQDIIESGVNLVRINCSHGDWQQHKTRIETVHQICKTLKTEVGVLVDLQGPKIRVARFKKDKIELKPGQSFILDADLDEMAGNDDMVGIDYKNLPQDVNAGDTLLLDDGLIVLEVVKIDGNKINCKVSVGGILSNNKGINRKGGGLSAGAFTEKDYSDLAIALKLDIDYIAISFPRSASDITKARDLIRPCGKPIGIIAKIERTEAVANIDDIIKASDGVMVARGDLAVEIGDAEVPGVQKHIIARARALDKPVITATQMLESMISQPVPTRAEVSDVANAVLDNTDAVMLSAESAVGVNPSAAVRAMVRTCIAAEKQEQTKISGHRMECQFGRTDEAIAMAAMYIANHLEVRAIITLTESGSTPLWMSRIRTDIPIYALSNDKLSRGKMTLYRNVYPIQFDTNTIERWQINQAAIAELRSRKLLEKGDRVIVTRGSQIGVHGNTNGLRVLIVGDEK